ncbi:Hypothetical predicted protein [Paramuricea clavata]|uniref:Uncharacterized protein n=1 Tax=Paramuricea clavata TaxID=317549 RepID=A0A7D9HC15_PARCT|nr:Hypothetical predicted protein [Paramuricea clavata]
MGGLKKYPLDCKDKIVIDRKALPNELVKDTPVLVKLARKKALYKGQIHSSGTVRGYCIIFDDPRRDREWKRTKSLRVITDYVVVKGGPKLDNRDDTSCTSEEENATFLFNVTSKDNNTLNLPSQSTEQGSHNFQYAIPKPKIFHSGLPTMVHYGQSTVLHLPKSTTDDRRITSEIQSQDEYSVQQSSNLYSPVSTGLQTNRAGSQSNLTAFHSNVSRSETKLQSCVHDSRSNATSFQSSVADPRANLTAFQSDFAGSLSNRTCFQYDSLDPWTNLTSCQSTTGNEANFQSKFAQDILNYFPRRQNVSSGMERRNMDCTVRNIHSPIMNMAGNHHQRLMPLYIGGKTSDGNAIYYTLPTYSATPSPFTVAATDYHLFVPIERARCEDSSETFSYESEDAPKVHWSSGSSMVSNQERESVLSKYNSNFWPSFYTTEERSPCSIQDGTCTPNKSGRLPISSDDAKFNQDITYSIKQEEKSPCRFLVPSKINTLSNHSSYDTQGYSQFDSPEDDVSAKKYFHEVLSTCSTSTRSTSPTCAMEFEQRMEDISPPLCCQVQLQLPMSTTDGMGSAYTIPPAYQAKLACFIPPVHLEPPAYPNSSANFTPAYPTQPVFPIQPAPPTQPPQPTQPPHPTQPAYPTQRVHQIQPAYLSTPTLPSYSYMPLITKVECSAQLELDSLNQTELNNSQEYETLSSVKISQKANRERREWLDEQDSKNPNAADYFPPTGQNYASQSLSKVSGKNSEHDRGRPFESPSSPVTFNSQPSECVDLDKFPLTREERKRKILSAFGFENVQTSSSFSCKFGKVGKEEAIPPNVEAKEFRGVQNPSLVESSSTIGETSSGCMVKSNLDQVVVLSPSVIKAATILSDSSLQRWKMFNNLNSSVKRSLTKSLDETSTTRYKKKSGSRNTDGRRHEETHSICGQMAKGRNVTNSETSDAITSCGQLSSCSSGVRDQEKKDKNNASPCCDEITICNVSNTHKTVGIQVQSKNTKALRRPRICIHRQSTASQTQQATPSDTILLGKYKEGKKIHPFHKPSSEMSPPKEITNVKKVRKGKDFVKQSILMEEGNKEALPLKARVVEVETTSSGGFNTQQLDQLSLIASGETEDGEVGLPAVIHHVHVGTPPSDSLSTRQFNQLTSIASVESGNEEELPLARVVDVRTTLAEFECVNVQKQIIKDKNFATSKNSVKKYSTLPLVSNSSDSSHVSQESATTDANVSRTAQDTTASIRRDGESDDIRLRCDEVINENYIEPNPETSPPKEKSKEEMAVQLQITSRQVEVKFVDEATIFLYSEAQPSRFLTCL